jgi:hypothetical protein
MFLILKYKFYNKIYIFYLIYCIFLKLFSLTIDGGFDLLGTANVGFAVGYLYAGLLVVGSCVGGINVGSALYYF